MVGTLRSMAGRPTIRDVAELAGVHPGTASRALDPRREGRISAPTAERVRSAARRLGYVPDPVAQTLRAGRSAAVGVVVPDLANPVFPPIVQGIEDALAEAGYVALVVDTGNDPGRERDRIAALRARRCDGYIVASATLDGTTIGRLASGASPSSWSTARRAARRCPRSAATTGPASRRPCGTWPVSATGSSPISPGRPTCRWCRPGPRHSRPPRASSGLIRHRLIVRHCPALTASAAKDGALALLAEAPAVTAILAGNDLMALGCYAAAQQADRPCPASLSIVGYNDMPFVEWWHPALTTVRIPQYDIGREAAHLLLERFAQRHRRTG